MELKDTLINECRVLLKRISYLSKKKSDSMPQCSRPLTYEEDIKAAEKAIKFDNICERRNLLIKVYFTQVILDLVYLIHEYDDVSNKAVEISINSCKRFRYGEPKELKNIKDLIFFFRDAICHPEERQGEKSPRRSVDYDLLDKHHFMTSAFDKERGDTFFQMGDCEIMLNDIKDFLETI